MNKETTKAVNELIDKMPKDYNHLSLGKFEKITELAKDKSFSDEEKQMLLLCNLLGLTQKEIGDMPIRDVAILASYTSFLEKKPKIKKADYSEKNITLGGRQYVVRADYMQMTTAQYIDFQTMIKKGDYTSGALAIFIIPKGKKYNEGYEIKKVADDIRKYMSVTDAFSMTAFFLKKLQNCITSILSSSGRIIRKLSKMEKEKIIGSLTAVREMWALFTAGGTI